MTAWTTMRCAYCGIDHPWYDRRWWPSAVTAICWPCAMKQAPSPRPAWWWRTLARLVRIRW